MRVSVITACFNRAGTIGQAIESVSRQTYRDIEHIVVDGGSTDGTLDVIAAHRRSITRLLRGPDKGIYDALNKGVRAASGDVVGFLHSDDVYAADDVIERVATEMELRALDVLYGDIAFVRANDVTKLVRVYSSRRFSPSRIAWGWMPPHPGLFLRRALFDEIGFFKTNYAIAGDFEFIARLFARGGLRHAYLPAVLVKMRLGGASTQGLRSFVVLNREVLRACRENGIETNCFKILSKYPAKILEFVVR